MVPWRSHGFHSILRVNFLELLTLARHFRAERYSVKKFPLPNTKRVNSVSNGRPTPAELGAMFDGGIASSGL